MDLPEVRRCSPNPLEVSTHLTLQCQSHSAYLDARCARNPLPLPRSSSSFESAPPPTTTALQNGPLVMVPTHTIPVHLASHVNRSRPTSDTPFMVTVFALDTQGSLPPIQVKLIEPGDPDVPGIERYFEHFLSDSSFRRSRLRQRDGKINKPSLRTSKLLGGSQIRGIVPRIM